MFDSWVTNVLDIFQVYLLTMGVYWVLKFLRGTRAAQMLIGVGGLFLSIYFLTIVLDLDVLREILRWSSIFFLLALLVVFHPEIRRALSILGRNTTIQLLQGNIPETPIERIIRIARSLANARLGALIALERTVSLERWAESGIALDALVSEELLTTIFTPPLPLHDGGAIIRGERLVAAHCIFPIDNEESVHGAGMRHRAALSLSTECDAIILVVSEERGQVSIAREGALLRNLSDHQLRSILETHLAPQHSKYYHLPWYLRPIAFLIRRPKKEGDK